MSRAPSRVAPPARLSETPLRSLDAVTQPWPGSHVEVGGAQLFVRRTPAGGAVAEPALFVHGLGGSSQNWTDLAGLLRERTDIEAIDLPGFGRSEPPRDRRYSIQAQTRTVIAYLQQSGRAPVHLVGNSMGGAISVHVAAQRPDLVRTLTLISPAVPDVNWWRVHPLRSDPLLALVVVPWLGNSALRKLAQVAPERRVEGMLAACFADPSRFPARRRAEAVIEATERASTPWANEALLRATRGLVRSQLLQRREGWAAIRRIAAPTLVLWGDRDRLVAPELAGHVAAEIAGARLLVLADTGHVAMMEDPNTSARAIHAFVADTG